MWTLNDNFVWKFDADGEAIWWLNKEFCAAVFISVEQQQQQKNIIVHVPNSILYRIYHLGNYWYKPMSYY